MRAVSKKRKVRRRLDHDPTPKQASQDEIQKRDANAVASEIEEMQTEWLVRCTCGINEKNYDDGEKMVECVRCQAWQHTKCVRRQNKKHQKKGVPPSPIRADYCCPRCTRRSMIESRRLGCALCSARMI